MLVPPRQALISSFRRLFAVYRFFVSRGSRFLPLSSAIQKIQIVWDRGTRSFFRHQIRDHIDLAVFDQIFLDRQYDISAYPQRRLVEDFYAECISTGETAPRPLILDIGSNIGVSTHYFSALWPSAVVVAVEPEMSNFEISKRNAPDATLVFGAVTDRTGFASIINPEADAWGYRVKSDDLGKVPSFTISSLLKRHPDTTPFILKIDVEGSESLIFAGDVSWVDLFPLIIIELHDWMLPGESNSANFLRAIAGRNRDIVVHGENLLSFRNTGIWTEN
jgi:FkbM family methyltransferase